MLPSIDSSYYVVVLAGDDPAENDGDPLSDGADGTNPGAGTIQLRGEAFGPGGVHQVVEITVARGETPDDIRIISWRLVR
jgi:hypothetical protein